MASIIAFFSFVQTHFYRLQIPFSRDFHICACVVRFVTLFSFILSDFFPLLAFKRVKTVACVGHNRGLGVIKQPEA